MQKHRFGTALFFCFAMITSLPASAAVPDDPFLWLEDVGGTRALDWVKAQNAHTSKRFESQSGFASLRQDLLAVLDSPTRIPYATRQGDFYYNFWRDAAHPRGVWRRTTPESYRQPQPEWETVLDLDELAQRENENWVWKHAQCQPHAGARCLLSLSRGGGDAVVIREFDLGSKAFVPDGFMLSEGKSEVSWQSENAIFVGTYFGEGSLTDSGYPRIVKLWQRGTPLSAAKTVLGGTTSDVSASATVQEHQGRRYELVQRATSFYTNEYYLREGERLARVQTPEDAVIDFFGPQMLMRLRKDYVVAGGLTYKAGSLLAIDFAAFQSGERKFQVLFEPNANTAIESMLLTRDHLVLNTLDKVKGRLMEFSFEAGRWISRNVEAPAFGSLEVLSESEADSGAGNDYFLKLTDFLTPDSLFLMHAGQDKRELLKQRPAFFNAQGLEVAQYEARSKDGTMVPYFIVKPKGMKFDGRQPTLLYGYGGFEVSLTPAYSAGVGKAWLEKGGVYVLANIRGGGEFGPRWHEGALKEKRQNAYDDFIAVAQDLIARKVTTPKRLGIMGGSNGGLLMGVMLTERPDLFGAVVCQVPLLDMRRYNKLLAGASWMGEYGNPDDPAEWAYIKRYSPYHNVRKGTHYPNTLFVTSTRDDRVHPGHARKMMAKMQAGGVKNLWYYENTEGGHAGAANNQQTAHMSALAYTFLWEMLGGKH